MSEWRETEFGSIPIDWKLLPFGELLEQPLKNGLNKPSRVRGNGYKMVNMNEIFAFNRMGNIPMELVPLTNGEKKTSLLKKYDLLFARQSLVFDGAGKCSIFLSDEKDVCFEGHLIRARIDRKKANPLFYYYFFSSKRGKLFIRTIVEQAVVAGIRGSDLKELFVPCPPKFEQDIIADLADTLDAKIDLLRRQNHTLEQIAQTLFKRWFVEFEFPNDHGQPYKSSGWAMQPSELGEIPEGWRVINLGDVSQNRSKTYDFANKSEVIFINTGDVQSGHFLHSNYVEVDLLPGQAKKVIEKDDILYSEIRPINQRFAYVNFDAPDHVVSTKFMVVRANEKIMPRLLYLILTQSKTIQEFQTIAESRSGTFPQITFDSISSLKICLPNADFQQRFLSVATLLIEKQEHNIQQIRILTRLRDTLLPKLMSGQLRVQA